MEPASGFTVEAVWRRYGMEEANLSASTRREQGLGYRSAMCSSPWY
jgi:hypothetical protein